MRGIYRAPVICGQVYTQSKADLDQGLSGVRLALRLLRDYYAGEEVGATSLVQQPEASGDPTLGRL